MDKIASDYLSKAEAIFVEYRTRRAPATLARQHTTMVLLARELPRLGQLAPTATGLQLDPASWQGITADMIRDFCRGLLAAGYALGTINGHLATLKTYARLAGEAGAMPPEIVTAILQLRGWSRGEGYYVDERRRAAGQLTRVGWKKETGVILTAAQGHQLLASCPDTPQGRRDRLLLVLLLEHGLRAGEVARLTVSGIDLGQQQLRFFRPKVHKNQVHRLTITAYAAAQAYLQQDALAVGPLLRASNKSGLLTSAGLSTRAITARVRLLGARVLGIANLSAHDLRHYWATQAARGGTPVDRLQEAGGWSSAAMALRYVAAAQVANEGVILSAEHSHANTETGA